MIIEFHDQQGQRLHDKFQDWRREHLDAYFLSFSGKNLAQLHVATCRHIGGINWDGYAIRGGKEQFHSNTKKRKVCADSQDELLLWAGNEGVTVKFCSDCIEEVPAITHVTSHSSAVSKETASERNENVVSKFAVLAVEGILRETMVITKSRNGTLRKAALENARGTCEACGVDYSHVLDGVGLRVLQVHHKQQLALADEPQVNGIEDLAVVCANCHQMIHADMTNAMSVDELRKRLRM